jgi:large subunit ribosomal protein L38e
MPVEIKDKEKFIELSENADECRIKRNKDNIKLKLRTGKYLYTLKLEASEADEVEDRLNCPIVEI